MASVNRSNYYRKKYAKMYMGASQYKAFRACESKALAELKGLYKREESTPLLQGKYYDAYFEGKLPSFCKKNSDLIYKGNGDKYSYIKDVDRVIERVAQDEEYMRLTTGKQQVIMTGVIQGVPFKIMIDSLLPDECIVDRKLMAGFPDAWVYGERLPWWQAWGYDIQAAIYQYIYEQNIGDLLPFRLAAASKEKNTDIRVCEFTKNTLQNALGEVMANVERYQAIKQGEIEPIPCGECDWCRAQKKIVKGEYELI